MCSISHLFDVQAIGFPSAIRADSTISMKQNEPKKRGFFDNFFLPFLLEFNFFSFDNRDVLCWFRKIIQVSIKRIDENEKKRKKKVKTTTLENSQWTSPTSQQKFSSIRANHKSHRRTVERFSLCGIKGVDGLAFEARWMVHWGAFRIYDTRHISIEPNNLGDSIVQFSEYAFAESGRYGDW